MRRQVHERCQTVTGRRYVPRCGDLFDLQILLDLLAAALPGATPAPSLGVGVARVHPRNDVVRSASSALTMGTSPRTRLGSERSLQASAAPWGRRLLGQPLHVGHGFIEAGFRTTGQGVAEHELGGASSALPSRD